MISGHYPMTFSTPYSFVIVALVLLAGGVVRHFYNERHAGRGDAWWAWGLAAACVAAAIFVSMAGSPAGRAQLGLTPQKQIEIASPATIPKHIGDIILTRCAMCHAKDPLWMGVAVPPKGILLQTPDQIMRAMGEIRIQAVLTHAMPPNNITQMTTTERQVLAAWLATP
jgi:uncharacterized membrane protein